MKAITSSLFLISLFTFQSAYSEKHTFKTTKLRVVLPQPIRAILKPWVQVASNRKNR